MPSFIRFSRFRAATASSDERRVADQLKKDDASRYTGR